MQKLKTTHFSVQYENGAVRWIKSNGVEVLRMIYSAVRDHNWGTIEPEIISEKIDINETGFQVKVKMNYLKNDIHFEAFYSILGCENRLVFEMDGEAHSTFKSNRTGFCVLHPINECQGKSCEVVHADGTTENAAFPVMISPTAPMMNIAGMEWKPSNEVKAKLRFSGDVFEMEDQRNWTDASFKTFCRPLALPFPYEIEKGQKIQQKIVLELDCPPETEKANKVVTFRIDKNSRFNIPEIGVERTSRNEPLEPAEAEILKQLHFGHLRTEIRLFDSEWKVVLDKSISESELLDIPLFIILYFSENFFSELAELESTLQNLQLKVQYIMVVGKNHLPDEKIFEAVFPALKSLFPETRIGSGVNAYFAELNRNRQISEKAEFVSFTISPQVHAFDNASLVENLEAQKYAVDCTKTIFPRKPVFVSPVTLRQRFNVVATTPELPPKPGELPSQVDVRQNSVFAAQWLLGSIKYLAQSGTKLATFFETVGWRGFIQGNYNPPVPEKFSARKEDIFPIYWLLKELSESEEVIFSESSSPLELDGVVLHGNNDSSILTALFANFGESAKQVQIVGTDQILYIPPGEIFKTKIKLTD